MTVLIFAALGIGIIAGLRAMMPLAAVSWAVRFGYLTLAGTKLAFVGTAPAAWVFTALALLELINDQNPKTPSRLVPPQFITRVVTGSFGGAAIGLALGSVWIGLLCGAVGAVIGTLGGAFVRKELAAAFGKDLPAGLIEDAVAIVGSYVLIIRL